MAFKLKPVADQVIVVTGASSGIGLATAREAARRGAGVLLVARNEEALRRVCHDIRSAGGRCGYAVADVGDEEQVKRAAETAVALFGRIDTWVNNAGVAIYARLAETPLHEHRRMFQTNYWGAVNGATEAVRHLKANGGALITVASVAADMGSPILGAYAASKHAVKGYIDSLRIELLHDGAPISVTLIKPSGIGTPLGEHGANHLDGEAKIPPPVYAAELVTEAILHAAEHPTREMVVGGAGQAQILLATHAPGLFDRVAGSMIGALHDPKIPKTATSNLFGPAAGGKVQGRHERPRGFSVYTSLRLEPRAAMAACLALAVVAGAVGRQARLRRTAAAVPRNLE